MQGKSGNKTNFCCWGSFLVTLLVVYLCEQDCSQATTNFNDASDYPRVTADFIGAYGCPLTTAM